MLLVCERCDKAYHTYCLTPPLDHRPSVGWSCKVRHTCAHTVIAELQTTSCVFFLCSLQNCRICRCCGVRSSGKWASHPFLCKSCDPALPCPLCDRPPKLYSPQDTLTCVCCYRYLHSHSLFLSLSEHKIRMKKQDRHQLRIRHFVQSTSIFKGS